MSLKPNQIKIQKSYQQNIFANFRKIYKTNKNIEEMQTIIFTDNKRLSTDYSADKTLFAQKIDVNHILNTQVYQSHISRVRFWLIKSNIASQQNFVLQVCKNLVNRGSNSINFQFSISKIFTGQQLLNGMDQKRVNSANDKFNRPSRMSGFLSPTMHKTIQFPPFFSNFKKDSTHNKTNSNLQWSYQNELNTQFKKSYQTISTQKQQEVNLKTICKKQFQISSLNDLNNIFINRESIYKEFLLTEENISMSKKTITNYIFKQNQIEIGISVISQGSKKYLQKSINILISEAFNAQFNSRKQAYETTCLTQNFSNLPKSSTKLSQQIPKQTYHKILLFLITHYDLQSQKVKSSTILTNKQHNRFIQAVQDWRIKDQDINVTQKLSKQYVLIKQEIQNQKNNFKNKLKIFQAIIGESVNVDKLLNQQKQMENSSSSTGNNVLAPNNQPLSSGVINEINSRASRKSQAKNGLSNPQTAVSSNSSNNSQFKRLKQSFQMIRNIDNVINQQNKKIQNMKKYLKQVIKQKNQTLYKHARSLNQVKKQIKTIKQEIQQKKLQLKFKTQILQSQKVQNKRNFVPTKDAAQLLSSNINLFKKIIVNERTNKNNQRYLIEDPQPDNHQNKQNLKYETINDKNKKFLIRKQHKSFYNLLQPANVSSHSNTIDIQHNQSRLTHSNIFKSIHQGQQQKQQKLMKKRSQQAQHHNLWMDVNKQQIRKIQNYSDMNNLSNQKQKQILIKLYNYYKANSEIFAQIQSEVKGYKTLKNQTLIEGPSRLQKTSQSASQLNLYQSSKVSIYNKTQIKNQELFNFPPIYLQVYPILNNILNPRISESAFESQECSVVSQSFGQILSGKQQNFNTKKSQSIKRVTIQNMFGKK